MVDSTRSCTRGASAGRRGRSSGPQDRPNLRLGKARKAGAHDVVSCPQREREAMSLRGRGVQTASHAREIVESTI
jgi:hypothetical protein